MNLELYKKKLQVNRTYSLLFYFLAFLLPIFSLFFRIATFEIDSVFKVLSFVVFVIIAIRFAKSMQNLLMDIYQKNNLLNLQKITKIILQYKKMLRITLIGTVILLVIIVTVLIMYSKFFIDYSHYGLNIFGPGIAIIFGGLGIIGIFILFCAIRTVRLNLLLMSHIKEIKLP